MAYLSSGKKKLLGSDTEGKGINIWQPNTDYKVNDLCLYKNTDYYSLYICTTEHTSAETFDETKWEQLTYDIPTKVSELENDSNFVGLNDTQASNTTTYSSNKIADLITEATMGKDLGNLLIAENSDDMASLATKDNLGKSALYIGDDTYNYTKGEIYELYWDAITIDYLSFAYSPIAKFNFTKIQALLGNKTSLTVTGEYGYQDKADWRITTNIGMDGSNLGVYGITFMQNKIAFGDKFKYTYNNSKKNSYSWLPTSNRPTSSLTKTWYNIDKCIMYNGIDGMYKKGRVYKLTGDKVTISTNSSEISNLAIDKNKFLNNCSLRGDIFFRWYNSGGYFTLLHNGGGDTERYTKEQFNSWGITYDGDITIDNKYIEIVTSKELSISDWEWKDVTDIDAINTELDKKFEGANFVKKDDITNTIDINSSDIKIPNVKAIYNDIIEGKEIDQTVIDKYGTEILKYPLGIWRIGSDSISNKLSDLPVKTSGRIEITSIDADTNKNPWNNNWAYRVYNFETYNGMNYFRKLSSAGTAGVKYDTGWQRVCGTTVDDVGVTTITPVNSSITGTIEYTVKNGICYVSMKDLMSTVSAIDLSISTTMPKPSINVNAASVNSSGNIASIYIDKVTTELKGNFYEKNVKSHCSFSYPVAES